jgi:hypothetical protein
VGAIVGALGILFWVGIDFFIIFPCYYFGEYIKRIVLVDNSKNMKNISLVLLLVVAVGGLALAMNAGAQAEVQQGLDSVSQTLDTVAAQAQSVKEKGLVQTVRDNLTAPFATIWQQITGIFSQLGGILSIFGK